MIEVLIPRVVHEDSKVASQPQWDPLIGICNPFKKPQTFVLSFTGMNGEEELADLTYTLVPGASIATTLIRGNVFQDPPQNFEGYGKIIFPDSEPFGSDAMALPAMVILGGNGPTPKNWNYATPNVPLIGGLKPQSDRAIASRWVFPYTIPYFDDPNQHHDDHGYRAGLSVTNLGNVPATLTIVFTRGDFYDDNRRQRFEATVNLAPKCSIAKYLHELIPDLLGVNQEGWLDIVSDAPADLMMYLIGGCSGFDWQAWGSVPFVIS